jgi:hypothetical protein
MAMTAGLVPLGVLLRREVTKERMERPDVLCGEACRVRKGEDFTMIRAYAGKRVAGDPSTSFSVFAVRHCSDHPPFIRVEHILGSTEIAVSPPPWDFVWLALRAIPFPVRRAVSSFRSREEKKFSRLFL